MALPTSRNTTYVAGATPVKAADLNDLQDQIIAINAGRIGTGTLILDATMARADSTWTFSTINGALAYEPRWMHSVASNEVLIIPIPLKVGDRISGVKVHVKQGTATLNAIRATLYKSDVTSGTATFRSATVGTTAAATRQTIDLTGIVAADQAANERWFIVVEANANIAKEVFGAEVTFANA